MNKSIIVSKFNISYNTGFGIKELKCPNCNKNIKVGNLLHKFCPNCGIQWIEEKGEQK